MNDGFEVSGTAATHGKLAICKTDGSCIGQHRNSSNNNHSSSNNYNGNSSGCSSRVTELLASGAMECLPMSNAHSHTHPHTHLMSTSGAGGTVVASPTATVVVGATYPHHLHHLHHHHHNHPLSHHAPYSSNSYGSHPHHHPIHSEQTKSLQELQHEVGALLEFRDLVIETFPDLKHKMASMSVTPTTPNSNSVGALGGSHSVGGGGSSSLAARREWEPGIRIKRKLSHKEPSTTTGGTAAGGSTSAGVEPSSASSLTRSRSNSHSGKKEPKSGENNSGSVVQDSGFSTETSSSKEGHSASSTNGAMTTTIATNRLSCTESDDELLNLLDVIHRKSNRLREEVEHLQSYERQQGAAESQSGKGGQKGMTAQQFREHVERLNREDLQQLRKERDRLLDKLAEMEAETLTGRIKAAKMSDQVDELISVKKDLEEQLKLAMAQKLELSSRVQQLQMQQQQQQQQSKSSSSEFSSQRNFLSSATTVLSNSSRPSLSNNTFQPINEQQQQQQPQATPEAFHQSSGSDTTTAARRQQLGRLDGIVSTPGARNTKCRITDSKRFSAILLETNVLELQRHLLTLTVQNQVLAQKLDSSGKSKGLLAKRLDKSQEDTEELRFQLEEKNIELEGTKAQLRVLESRLHSSSSTNSYLNSASQHDYETNRSSASTTLMPSRRGVPSDSVDATTTTTTNAIAMTRSDQIITPSMKAMVPLAMDELQQHSSSTESAHEHEPNDVSKTIVNSTTTPSPLGSSTPTQTVTISNNSTIAARVMSASFEQTPLRSHGYRKFNSASKPSKIPLPGSKAAAYFAGKPPTGRGGGGVTTTGRSPPSVHNNNSSSSVSYGSGSKSSLSRSTGNLSQSLKRADSASNHSLSTNTSRSSTSSSIPLATTPYSSSNRSNTTTTTKSPSPRVLQNSPLPKLKRETLSSRVRHLDSLSRAQQSPEQQQQQQQSIAAQLSTTLRKDLQLTPSSSSTSSYHPHSHHHHNRRSAPVPTVSRRFSSASVASGRLSREDVALATTTTTLATPTSSYGDSDSGKRIENCH